MVYKIINITSVFFMVLMTGVMVFTFRKPRRITGFSALLSVFISLITPVIFLMLSGTEPDLRLLLPFFGFGLLLGYLRGVSMKLKFVGDQVVGRHSRIFLLLWGFSLALNQFLSTLDSTKLMAVGLTALFLSTGTQVGFYGMLAARRVGMIPEELVAGKMPNKRFQWIISLAFGILILVFLLETLVFSIPYLSFMSLTGSTTRVSGEELPLSEPDPEQELQTEEDSPTFKPYFNGEQILVWTRPLAAFGVDSEQILYSYSADGSSASNVYDQPVTAIDIPDAPYLSPDGNLWIVGTRRSGEFENYLMSVDGSQTYSLLYQNALVTIKDWSPDASQIAVQSQPAGNWDVLITDREGKDWQIVANKSADEIEPRWSPDGESILYQSNEFGNQDIYLVNLKSGNHNNLTSDPAKDQRASWALNGARIVFTSDRDGVFSLYQMDPDGSNVQIIAQDPSCGFMYQLSPDSQHLIYHTDPEYDVNPGEPSHSECGRKTLFLFSLSTGIEIRLDDAVVSYFDEIWSPDSSMFLYYSNYDEVNYKSDLLIYHLDGSQQLIPTPITDSTDSASWSPDSSRVAQIEFQRVEEGPSSRIVTVTNIDGSNRLELAFIPWEINYMGSFNGFSWP